MASIVDARRMPRYLKKYSADDFTSLKLDQRLTVQDVHFYKQAADSLAADTTSDAFYVATRDLVLVEAQFIPHDVLTADDTNYATIAIKVSATALASVTTETTGSGNFVDNTPVALTNASAVAISDGDVLLFDIAKAGSGVAVPAGVLHVVLAEG